jgi:Flp pilus assembly protein TadB
MRHRILYLLPDLASARRMMDDLLLARVEERHIHFLAKRGTSMEGLHEASIAQKSDLVHGAQIGLVLGALLGCALGGLVAYEFVAAPGMRIVTVLAAALLGALFGMWVSSMVGSAVPNSRLKQFEQAIEQGKILLMVDVPQGRVDEIRERLHDIHPEAEDRGLDPHVPAFP